MKDLKRFSEMWCYKNILCAIVNDELFFLQIYLKIKCYILFIYLLSYLFFHSLIHLYMDIFIHI